MNILKDMCNLAIKARDNSYSPYSGVRVGAALLAGSGKIYTGCNIENAAFSPTVCAERVAFFKAISEGEKEFTAIAIAGGADEIPDREFPPCGVCRQFLYELCGGDLTVYLEGNSGIDSCSLSDLLPRGFSGKSFT